MKIFLAADHGGFALKEKIKPLLTPDFLAFSPVEIVDCGAYQLDPDDDYPEFVISLGRNMQQAQDTSARGIIFCRSGIGVAMVANKIHGLRCGNCFNAAHTRGAVEHNHINVLALAADYLEQEQMMEMIRIFLVTAPDEAPRHARRLAQITQLEECGVGYNRPYENLSRPSK